MTDLQAKHAMFTHKGYIYGFIKIYARNPHTEYCEICEKNMLYGLLLDLFSWIDLKFGKNEGFNLEVKKL